MTDVEYRKLLEEFGERDVGWMVDKLNAYKGSTGKKYKSDYLALQNWVVGELKREKAVQARTQKPSTANEIYRNENYWSNGNTY